MHILTAENLSKSYGPKTLFENINFGIEEGDKIGLVGINGTGKSSLLKIIAGVDMTDTGKIVTRNDAQIEYLPQESDFNSENTVLAEVFKGNLPIMKILREYEEVTELIRLQPEDEAAKSKQIKLGQKIDLHDGWQIESDAKTILTKLGITDFSSKVGTLSGGQRKRIALAAALITPADLLILDEPTNHIDSVTVAWLEQYLAKRKGALLMITHDRYFLDRVATKIIELDRGDLYTYVGNYTKFLELKAAREDVEEANERKRQNILRKELAWIRRGAKARTTKQKARIDRFEQLNAQQVNGIDSKIDISVGSSRLGKKIVELEHITHQVDRTIIQDFDYIVLREDRIGIIGPNGCGKSTLLNIIAGCLEPTKGTVIKGQTVKIGYFSQENNMMDERLRVIEYIKEEANFLTTADGKVVSAAQMLELFLFPSELQWTPISKLSGGEKRRLFLLRILMGAPNVLLLDEPTNDLDIQTLTVLEDYIDSFPGAVLFVSHDRYFIDRLAEKVFVFEGKGEIKQYPGGYSDYQEFFQQSKQGSQVVERPKQKQTVVEEPKRERPRRLSFKEQREYEDIEAVIGGVEAEVRAVTAEIDTAGSDFELLQKLLKQQQALECRLEELLARWEYLEGIVQELNK